MNALRRALFAAAICNPALVYSALAATVPPNPPPAWTQKSNGGDIGGQGVGLPDQFRRNAGISPRRVSIVDYGGKADAWQGGVMYGAQGANFTVAAVHSLTVTLTSAGGTSATISPASVVPDIAGLASQGLWFTAPGIGVSGATVNGAMTAANSSTGVISCNGCNFAAQTSTPVTVTFYPNASDNVVGHAAAYYGGVTIANLTDTQGTLYGSQITLARQQFPYAGGDATATDGARLCIRTSGQSDWCGTIVNEPSPNTGTVVNVVGAKGFSAAIPYTQSAVNSEVYWGWLLARPTDAGRAIEVPLTGTGTNILTGQTNNTVGTIASYIDPLNVTLTASVTTNVSDVLGEPIIGSDDFPSYVAAINALTRNQGANPNTPTELYFPADSFMASVTTTTDIWQYANQCGEGTVLWPTNYGFSHGATSCGTAGRYKGFPDSMDLQPAVHLKHILTLAAGSTINIVTMGNSAITPGTNQANFNGSMHVRICDRFRQAYPDMHVVCTPLDIGGTQWADADPVGPSNGVNKASTSTASIWPAWWTDPTKPWYYFVEALHPDLIVYEWTNVDSIAGFNLGSLLSVTGYPQTTSWASTTGWNPDEIIATDFWQPVNDVQWSHGFVAGFLRSFTKTCATKLANGGCIGLLDFGRSGQIQVDGWDPEHPPMRRTTAVPTSGGSTLTGAWTYPVPRIALSGQFYVYDYSTTTNAANMFSAVGGEFDFQANGGALDEVSSATFPVVTAASAVSGQPIVTVGYDAYKLNTGYKITGSGVPSSDTISSISLSGATSAITLANNLTGTVASGATLTASPQGPSTTYPGGILRVGLDSSTGNLTTQYDTVYFQTAAGCSGASGAAAVTCPAATLGLWHQFLQVAIPGGGTSGCPAPSTATNCALGTITRVSGDGTTVSFGGTTLANAVSGVALTVYRTSSPRTVTSRSASTMTGNCSVNSGVYLKYYFQPEFVGSKMMNTLCEASTPGPSLFFDQFVERFVTPTPFTITSPNAFAGGGGSTVKTQFVGPNITGTIGSAGRWFEAAPEFPSAAAGARMVPDVYGYCAQTAPFGEYSPNGGQCQNHRGTEGEKLIDEPVLSAIRVR